MKFVQEENLCNKGQCGIVFFEHELYPGKNTFETQTKVPSIFLYVIQSRANWLSITPLPESDTRNKTIRQVTRQSLFAIGDATIVVYLNTFNCKSKHFKTQKKMIAPYIVQGLGIRQQILSVITTDIPMIKNSIIGYISSELLSFLKSFPIRHRVLPFIIFHFGMSTRSNVRRSIYLIQVLITLTNI